MSGPSYDTAALIDNVKRRCAVPTSQLTYLPADFTDLATDELLDVVVPKIMSAREEYFLTHVDLPVTNAEVEIPAEAAGEKLRTVAFLQQTSPLVLINLPRLDLDVVAGQGFFNYATLAGFFIEGNTLRLYPTQSVPQNTTVRLYYYRRLLALAAPSTYGEVISINSNTNTIQLSFVPSTWDTGTVLNAVSGLSPFGISNSEITIASVSSPSIIVDSVAGISVGDYISLQGYSAIPQIPIEAHSWLAQRTAVKCLEGLGDRDAAKFAQQKADELERYMMIMVSQRVDGSVKKVINPSGGLRINSGIWRRGYGRF